MVGDRVSVWRKVYAESPGAAERVRDGIARGRDVPPALLTAINKPQPLSPRQVDVLAAAADGMSMVDTAAKLGLQGIASVQSHRFRAVAKLRANNLTHAVALAIRGGMIP